MRPHDVRTRPWQDIQPRDAEELLDYLAGPKIFYHLKALAARCCCNSMGSKKQSQGSLHAAARSAHAVTVALSGIVLTRLGIFETDGRLRQPRNKYQRGRDCIGGRELLQTMSALGHQRT